MTKLAQIMKGLGISQRQLYRKIKENVEGTAEAPLGIANINLLINGKLNYAYDFTYEKVLNAINHFRELRMKYSKPLTMDDIVDEED